MTIIKAKELSKDYKYSNNKGFLYNLFNSQERIVKAVDNYMIIYFRYLLL